MVRETMFAVFMVLVIVFAAVGERLPAEKSGTIDILRTLNGESGGVDPGTLALKRVMRPSMPYSFDTPEGHFKVHYTLTGSDAVDSLGYVYKIGQYLERSRALYIDTIGYLPPPSDGTLGGDEKYDIYLRNLSSYGLTWPGGDGPQPWEDWTSYIEIDNDFSSAYPNDDPEGPVAGAAKITCAHEFHHAVQFGLRGSSTVWLAELTSVSMEERVYPYVNDYVWLIDYLTDDPHLPLDWSGGYHMYGLGLLGQFLDIGFGDGFLFSVWDTMRFIADWDALEAVCALDGFTLAGVMVDFASMALLIGSRDCGFFGDGAAFSDMTVENEHHTYPASGSTTNRPYGYGINYAVFDGLDGGDCDLSIEFDGDASADWLANAVWVSGDSVALYEVNIDTAGHGSVRVPFANEADFIGLAIVPAGNTSTRYDYSYTADIVPAGLAEERFPEEYSMRISPNPFNSSCVITVGGYNGGPVEIEVFDRSGRPVRTILSSGRRTIWDGRDNFGNPLPSGIYLCRIRDSDYIRRITLLK